MLKLTELIRSIKANYSIQCNESTQTLNYARARQERTTLGGLHKQTLPAHLPSFHFKRISKGGYLKLRPQACQANKTY